ncbi:MAG: hypothetical protein WCV72_02105 [Patescibacteria group bacterium]
MERRLTARKTRQLKKPGYEIHHSYTDFLLEEVESRKDKSPKVSLEIIRLLEDAREKSKKVILSWNLVESFVDDLCENKKEEEMQKNCRRNIRALFEGLEDSRYSLYSFS